MELCLPQADDVSSQRLPPHSRSVSIWDFAATACIFQELGLPVTNFEGGRLDMNRKDGTFMLI